MLCAQIYVRTTHVRKRHNSWSCSDELPMVTLLQAARVINWLIDWLIKKVLSWKNEVPKPSLSIISTETIVFNGNWVRSFLSQGAQRQTSNETSVSDALKLSKTISNPVIQSYSKKLNSAICMVSQKILVLFAFRILPNQLAVFSLNASSIFYVVFKSIELKRYIFVEVEHGFLNLFGFS